MNGDRIGGNAERMVFSNGDLLRIRNMKSDLEGVFFGKEGNIGDVYRYPIITENLRDIETGGSKLKAADLELYHILNLAETHKRDVGSAWMETKSANMFGRCLANYRDALEALSNRDSNDARYSMSLSRIDTELPSTILEMEDASFFLVEKTRERLHNAEELLAMMRPLQTSKRE